ncbi:DNA-binding protein H-NS [Rhodoferax sp. OV413]|uniref:H-NS histone family protein n=1 Tax=Rhodoferax sp. OV413 TaxID=1855285 RepID=UPI0008830F9A|nr:H-NS histone family protein [Rhodoferax sp. OV413]SDP62190.1 DNA-binding protein H-NS [Rhodoferax sp. OV413]
MTKTLLSIQKQIDKLQKEAASIREKEVGGVIERIKVAIDFYGLTVEDLFGNVPRAVSKRKGKATTGTPVRAAAGKKAKSKGVIKYRDEAGNAWTGHGMRPRWFKAALESGKTPDDLLVKP